MQETELLDLFDQYSNMIYRLAFSYLGSWHDAEDAVQSVFLKLMEGKARPIPGKERPFLTQVTVNYCRDELRASRRRVVPLDETIEWKEREDKELFDAVMSLPQKYRIVIHLHYYAGYSFPEIASFLEISQSAVSMRMHRGRKILEKQLRRD